MLCPAVITWEKKFRERLNESNTVMTDEQIADEFDKWFDENQDVINQSVNENIDYINGLIDSTMKELNPLNEDEESMFNFDDDEFAFDDEEDKPITGEVEGAGDEEEEAPEEEEEVSTIGKRSKITLNNKKNDKNNVFGIINEFYKDCLKERVTDMTHKGIFRRMDVSKVVDMSALFAFTDLPNIDLSDWNPERVKTMEGMFYKSTFNNDSICEWNVSSCTYFANMFLFCPFNFSLKKWTPGFISKTIKNDDGSYTEKTVRADLPIIGGTEDETRAIAGEYRRNLFKKWKEEAEEDEAAEAAKAAKAGKAATASAGVEESRSMAHVVDFDSFVTEGRFRDFIDRGVEKVKNFFKGVALKFNKLVAFFNDEGDIYEAMSPYTAMNMAASGDIPGVTAFSDVQNEYLEGVPAVASVVESPEYYGIIRQDSVEYRNYQTFADMLNEHYQKYGDTGAFQMINEDEFKRVGFSAADGGVVAQDIGSDDLREILEDLVENVPANKGDRGGKAVFIWGAPGIGKSTIPKAIVRAWNENKGDEFHKKALMVVQCGDLTIDGFSLPIPAEKSIGEYLDERPVLKDKIAASGVASDTLEKIKQNMHRISTEAPKTWLPAFKMNATQEEIDILNDIANGHLEIKNKDGRIVKTETTEGGILLFDEFFRANESVFKIMMQLILNREYSGYMLGNKWGILCCSNRPEDDEEVRTGFEKTGAVVGTRMLAGAYNFIPSFDEWKKWAVEYGGFDSVTLEFLMKDQDPENKEYTNWHTIRPDEYIQRGKTAWPTPRTWSALMDELNMYAENHGYSGIGKIPDTKMLRIASGIIGDEMAEKYVEFVVHHAENIACDPKAVLEDPSYEIPAESSCPDVTRQIQDYVFINYEDTNIPDVEYMMNMFNNLNKTYKGTKDNFVKMLHVNIMKHFKVMSVKDNRLALKTYLMAAEKRYKIVPADLR